MNRNEILDVLNTRVAEVTFTKVDGTERKMKATLLSEYVDPIVSAKGKTTLVDRPVNESVIRCVDTELNEWRSFRVDSVKSLA